METNIEGSYILTHRELPDGTVQRPPEVLGFYTNTKAHRHNTVAWKRADGKVYSESYLAEYQLAEGRYSETMIYLTVDDQLSGKATTHEFSTQSASSPVSVEKGVIKFAAPQPFEKAFSLRFEFEKNTFKAIAPGMFVDYWEKVS